MRPSRFSEEQIIGILREQESGSKTAEVCRRHDDLLPLNWSSFPYFRMDQFSGGGSIAAAQRKTLREH
jgi:putative transposase